MHNTEATVETIRYKPINILLQSLLFIDGTIV